MPIRISTLKNIDLNKFVYIHIDSIINLSTTAVPTDLLGVLYSLQHIKFKIKSKESQFGLPMFLWTNQKLDTLNNSSTKDMSVSPPNYIKYYVDYDLSNTTYHNVQLTKKDITTISKLFGNECIIYELNYNNNKSFYLKTDIGVFTISITLPPIRRNNRPFIVPDSIGEYENAIGAYYGGKNKK